MVTAIARMLRLKTLLDVRLGPGAAVISPEVQRIHMKFAVKINDGHRGPRKFWHHYLPRLKYHNPAIPMTIERTTDQQGPASMTIEFARKATASRPEAESATQVIDMKHRGEDDILTELLGITSGVPVEATEEEKEELVKLEEARSRREAEAALAFQKRREELKQKELLERARQIGV